MLDPIFELCKVLHERGHSIELATLAGREHLRNGWPFVSEIVHLVGRRISLEEDTSFYQLLWESRGRQAGAKAKAFIDSFWAETYHSLCRLAASSDSRPDLIISDYQVEAAKDVAIEYNIPYAVVSPQFPWLIPTQHVPGLCGLHERCICTEGAKWFDRFWELSFPLRRMPDLVKIWRNNKKLRWAAGLKRMPQDGIPDYILLVNSFEGFEIPRDLPPNCASIGPLIAYEYPELDTPSQQFLTARNRVVYVGFGTHVLIDTPTLKIIVDGLSQALDNGTIDGIVLSMNPLSRERLQLSPGSKLEAIMGRRTIGWLMLDYAPQRAILEHPSTLVFLTHAGPSSVNEAMVHGKPMISLAVYGDQLSNALRIERAGIGRCLQIASFTPTQLFRELVEVITDSDGSIAKNVLRLQRIARIAMRGGRLRGADLIEQHMYDWELRFDPVEGASRQFKVLRGMHLQPPSARISWIKLHNIDIWVPILAVIMAVMGSFVWAAQSLWLGQAFFGSLRQSAVVTILGTVPLLLVFVGILGRFTSITDAARSFTSR